MVYLGIWKLYQRKMMEVLWWEIGHPWNDGPQVCEAVPSRVSHGENGTREVTRLSFPCGMAHCHNLSCLLALSKLCSKQSETRAHLASRYSGYRCYSMWKFAYRLHWTILFFISSLSLLLQSPSLVSQTLYDFPLPSSLFSNLFLFYFSIFS